MTTAQGHMDISDDFAAKIMHEFDRGDLLRASEKAWEAVAHCIKAISEERGWEYNGHRKLIENVYILIRESDSPAYYTQLILSANALHQNIYENLLPREMVRQGIKDAFHFIDFLKSYGENGTG